MKYLNTFFLILLVGLLQAQNDQYKTANGELKINPVLHASMVLEWQGKTIYIDPYGGAAKYASFSKPDLILITDIHGDHMNLETLGALDTENTEMIVPQSGKEKLGDIKAKKNLPSQKR